jgi:hypothetical protein
MKTGLVVAAALAALTAAPAGTAASFTGVAVAKDSARKAVVVASGRSARTLRAGARFARIRVGHRVVVDAARLPDGTYSANRVRARGRAERVRFAAVVVKPEHALRRVIVSAGGTVFAVPLGSGGRTVAAAGGGSLAPGDRVDVEMSISASWISSVEVTETGRAKLVELEGIFLRSTAGGFDLAVVARGLVHVEVPDGAVLPDFEPGDQVSMVVLIGRDGSFTFIRGLDESEKHEARKPRPKDGLEGHGVLVEKDPYSVTVRDDDGERSSCAVPAGMDLSIFRIGERVKLHCVSRENRDVLVKIHSSYGWVKADGTGQVHVHGALTTGAGTVSVRREDGMSVTCSVPAGVDFGMFRTGEVVKLHCRLGPGGFVLAAMSSETASLEDGVLELHLSGLLQPRTGAAVSVRRPDGSLASCTAPADFQLAYFAIGERVSLICHAYGGTYTLLKMITDRYRVGADGSVEVYLHGAITAKTETSVTVTASDGHAVTCSLPGGTDLGPFPVGTTVKMHCRKLGSDFRLQYLKSGSAAIEIAR